MLCRHHTSQDFAVMSHATLHVPLPTGSSQVHFVSISVALYPKVPSGNLTIIGHRNSVFSNEK